MPRTLATAFRNRIEASSSTELLLCFATIDHSSLETPIRVACDVVDYIYGGNRYIGLPFGFELVSDGERPPTARLRVENVGDPDRHTPTIGEIVLALPDSPSITLEVLSGSDFGDVDPTQDARLPIGTPTVEYRAAHLRLTNVSGDAGAVEGQLGSWDLSAEPWPAIRATQDRLPALYR